MFNKKGVKKATVGLLLGSLMVNSTIVLAEEGNRPKDFDKVSNYSKAAVDALYKDGLIVGYKDGTFNPQKEITRAEFAAMLIRVLKYTEEKDGLTFADSEKGKDWHYNTMNVAYNNGLLSGDGKDELGNIRMNPDKKITRLEMMVVLNRVYEKFGDAIELDQETIDGFLEFYIDGADVPEWARASVAESLLLGITGGVSFDEIGFKEKGNREQTAVFAYRAHLRKAQVEEERKLNAEFNQFVEEHPEIFTFHSYYGSDYQTYIENNFVPVYGMEDYDRLSTYVHKNLGNNEFAKEVKANNYKVEAELLTQLAPYAVDLEKYPDSEYLKFLENLFRASGYEKIQDSIPGAKEHLLKDSGFAKRYNAKKTEAFNKGGAEAQAEFEAKFDRLLAFDVLTEIVWNTNINVAEIESVDIKSFDFSK